MHIAAWLTVTSINAKHAQSLMWQNEKESKAKILSGMKKSLSGIALSPQGVAKKALNLYMQQRL